LPARSLSSLNRSFNACPSSTQQRCNGNILVNIFPVNPYPACNQSPIGALLGRGVSQPGKPFQRHRHFTAIGKSNVKRVIGKTDAYG
jgi:hypothetical protein